MIGRTHRFHGYGGLRGVYQRGQTARGPQLSLKFQYRPAKSGYRLAVVVSRKVSKSAVERNRIRRRLYEIVRRQETSLPAGIDLVFTVFSVELMALPDSQLQTMVNGLLRRAGRSQSESGRPTGETHDIVKAEGN